MKNLKKFASILFAFVLCASMAVAPAAAFAVDSQGKSLAEQLSDAAAATDGEGSGAAAASGASDAATSQNEVAHLDFVVDEGSLLSSNEISSLSTQANEVSSTYSCGAYYITVNDYNGYASTSDYADAIVNAYHLDTVNPKGCVVFLVCVPKSQFVVAAYGDAENTFDDSALQHYVNELNPYLGRSDWAGAGETFFDDVKQSLSGKTPNSTSDVTYNGTYVTDAYGLFSDTQRAALEAKATELAQKYNMGVYLLVVDKMNGMDNPSSAQRTNFATSFYRANDLGLGSGKDGIMLVLAVESRDYVTIAYGQGSYSFSDEGIAAMEDKVKSYLGDNDWVGGSNAYYDNIGEQLDYYAVRGKPWTEPDPFSLVLKILAMLGIPAGVAYGAVSSDRNAMKTARESAEAQSYLERGSFTLTDSDDQFVNTTLTVTPIPKSDDKGGGGGGGFGGGGWGGGGGGGFSSSGGGKF